MRPRLLYVSNTDGVEQRVAAGGSGDGYGSTPIAALCGRLRVASLFGDALVVSDAAVLDGALFLQAGPEHLRRVLGRYREADAEWDLPLQIMCRASTLSESLAALLRPAGSSVSSASDGNSARLRAFEFSSIADPVTRAGVREALSEIEVAALDASIEVHGVSSGMGQVLIQAGLPESEAAAMVAGWQRWLAADIAGELVIVPWPSTPIDLPTALARESVDWYSDRFGALAGETIESIRAQGPWQRSEAFAKIDRILAADPAARAAVRRWFSVAYSRAVATQYGALLMEFASNGGEDLDERLAARGTGSSRDTGSSDWDSARIAVGVAQSRALAELPREQFDLIRRRCQSAVQDWWAELDASASASSSSRGSWLGSRGRLGRWVSRRWFRPRRWRIRPHHRVAFVISESLEAPSLTRLRRTLVIKMLLVLVAGFALELAGNAVSSLVSLSLVVLPLLVITVAGDLADLWAMRRRGLDAVIDIRRQR